MDCTVAEAKIRSIFGLYGATLPSGLRTSTAQAAGKVYELFILTEVLKYLHQFGFKLLFSKPGHAVNFKSSHGLLKQSDPHFLVFDGKDHILDVFVDVEFTTLGAARNGGGMGDNSCHHEIDVGVYSAGQDMVRPPYDTVALAVECKAVAKIQKHVIRGMLGLRRELSLLGPPSPAILSTISNSGSVFVPAYPASEVWLCTTDGRVTKYQLSPRTFGIECLHEVP